jgi:hypothetical protein
MHQDAEVQYCFLDIVQLLQTSTVKLPTDTDPFTGLPTEAIKTSLRELLVGIYKSTCTCTFHNFPSGAGCDYENLLLSPIPHCMSNEFRPKDIIIGASRAFTHYPIDHITFVDYE